MKEGVDGDDGRHLRNGTAKGELSHGHLCPFTLQKVSFWIATAFVAADRGLKTAYSIGSTLGDLISIFGAFVSAGADSSITVGGVDGTMMGSGAGMFSSSAFGAGST